MERERKEGKFLEDVRGAQVVIQRQGRTYLGDVREGFYGAGEALLDVRHFDGERWPFFPRASEVEVLERSEADHA